MTRALLLNDIEMLALNRKSATIQNVEEMVSLTVTFPLIFRISKRVTGEEHKGSKTSHTKSQSGSEQCWLCEAMRSSGNVMIKPQRWISVEEDELTMDHGGGRERVVRVCSCFCHIPFHVFASSQERTENAIMCIMMYLVLLMEVS